jgi:peptide/nickel transport system substrate-binding protein
MKTLALVPLAALALAACGSTDTKPQTTRGGTLTTLWSGDVDSIDPGITYYSGGYMVSGVTQRTPIAYKPGVATAVADLARTLPEVSPDGRTVTVRLRDGVRFSPPVKREVVAADVKYAIERGFSRTVNNPYAPAYFGDVEGAEPGAAPGARISGISTPDEHTVVFKLRRPTGGTLAAALVLPLAAPVPREYALRFDRAKVSGYGPEQVATGPYMVGAYEPGKRITLVRNPSWRAATDFRPAYLDRIEMPQGNDDSAQASLRVLNGSHMVTGDFTLPPVMLKEAVTKRPSQLRVIDSGGGRWAAMNTTVAPFDDVDVRKAVVAGFDRRAVQLALGGERVGTIATHFLPPGTPGFEQAGAAAGPGADYLAAPEGDPALAATYLKKAGFANGRYNGEPILMVAPSDGNGRRIAEIAKASFAKLGFDVQLRLMAQQTVITKYCGAASAAVAVCPNVGWGRDFADGQAFLDATFNGEHITPVGNANVSQLNVPAINAAMDRASTLADPASRAAAWGRIDRDITAQAPAVPLVWDKVSMAASADVRAVPNENLGVWDFSFTSLK